MTLRVFRASFRLLLAALAPLLATGCGDKTTTPPTDHLACVSGTVLAGGAPGAGAVLTASTGAATAADAAGRYELRLPPDSSIIIRVLLTGADSSLSADSAVVRTGVADGACTPKDFSLAGVPSNGACVSGVVHFNFTPVPGARVTAQDGRVVHAGSDGRYRLQLPAGAVSVLRADAVSAGQSLRATVAVSPAGPGCTRLDLSLAPEATGLHAEVWLEADVRGNSAPGSARARVWNEQTGQPVAGANLTFYSVDSSYVFALTPTGVPGEYSAPADLVYGTPAGTLYAGSRFILGADLDGTGTRPISAGVIGPSWVILTTPVQGSTRPSSFEAVWKVAPGNDSSDYEVLIKNAAGIVTDRKGVAQGTHQVFLDGVAQGHHLFQMHAASGGLRPTPPNLTGPGIFGHLWSEFHGKNVDVNVVSGVGGRQ